MEVEGATSWRRDEGVARIAGGECHDSSHASLKSKEFCEGRMVGQPYGVPRGDWWQQLRGRQLAGQRAVGRFVVGQRAWLASGRGWPAGVVGLRIRLAYGAWLAYGRLVGLRICARRGPIGRSGWKAHAASRSSWGAREAARRFWLANENSRGVWLAYENSRRHQNGPVAPRIGQRQPELPRIAQKLPETGWPADSTKPSGSHRQLSHHVQNSLQGVKLPKSP
ncbi:uncharacterized protein LOC122722605 isoform X1 [Manihot esculenta]|uniref:uncharacterized protein LOC122722605 isoform X1 n=2 Tax=Manihot esculenta TaxID=3983 RepID=UPI001CC5ECDF|nr:uncharacterized protein LOC122722605 isoform X1 [Manihot esculenta]